MASQKIWRKKKIKYMYTNADMLMNKREELKDKSTEEWPDIIGICEVKYKNMNGIELKKEEFKMDNEKYEIFETNIEKDVGRGLIMYADKNLKADKIILKSKAVETLVLQIDTEKGGSLIVALIYRAGSSSKDNSKKIREALDELASMNAELIIMGDFNYKEINWEEEKGSGKEQDKFIACIQQNMLIQNVKEVTRFRGSDTPSRVDLVFTTEERAIDNIRYLSPLGKSDHNVLIFETNINIEREIRLEKKKIYKKANMEGMEEEMDQIDWEEEFKVEESSMEDIIKTFNDRFNKIQDDNIPTCIIDNTKGMRPPLDDKMRDLIRQKDIAARKVTESKKTGNRYEIDMAESKYNKIRNRVRGYSRYRRKEYEKGIAMKAKESTKEVFAYMNSKSKTRGKIGKICIDPTNEKSEKTEDDERKAGIFSKFFISVQTTEPEGDIPDMEHKEIKFQMEDIEVIEEKVKELLESIKENTAAGPDGHSPRVLKPLASVICKPLAIICRESLKRGKVPKDWKIQWITVIYKQGTKTLAENYRPVSLTSILSKIQEKIVRTHIMDHMTRNKLFSKRQYGFLGGRSTVLQLLCVIDNWTEALDEGIETDCIYADFKKAFDKVPHKRLMKKVRAYGIKDNLCNWIEDFLKDRIQRVSVNGKTSSWEKVISGIPQGTVLGPLLFVIFINDLPEDIESLIFLFADDSKIWRNILGAHDRETLQKDLHKMKAWSEKWMLEFHPDKLKHLHISRQSEEDIHSHTYYVGGDAAKEVKSEKDLGIHMDSKINFEGHMDIKTKKANSMIGMIKRTFQFLTIDMFNVLYKAMVRNGFEYGQAVWSPYLMKDIEKIEGVQRRATKIIHSLKDKPYEERLRILKLPTLRYRRARGDMIETYKIVHGIYDKEAAPKLDLRRDRQGGRRGHPLSLFQHRARLELRRNSFTIRVVKTWNNLTKEIVEAPNVNTFKNRLDKYWGKRETLYNYKIGIMEEVEEKD